MKSITNLILIVMGLFLSAPIFAQKDAKAKELLDKSSATLNQSGGMSASFSVNITDDANKMNQSFEGQTFLNKAKFFIETPDQTIYFDGKTQWVYNKAIDEVSILEPNPQDIQVLNPVSVFELYKNGYNYKYNGEKTDIKKRKVYDISLFPTDKKDEIKQVNLQINPSDYMPVFFHIIYKNKMEFRVYINKYQTKLNLPDSQFVFDKSKYPKAEINDLR